MDDQGGESPFGQALSLNGPDDTLVIPTNENLRVGKGSFTVSAWIFPEKLQQGGHGGHGTLRPSGLGF